MSQTRIQSAVEAATNVAIGYGVGVAANAAVLPLFGHHTSFADNLGIAAVFTVIALVRSYLVRRWFNRKGGRA